MDSSGRLVQLDGLMGTSALLKFVSTPITLLVVTLMTLGGGSSTDIHNRRIGKGIQGVIDPQPFGIRHLRRHVCPGSAEQDVFALDRWRFHAREGCKYHIPLSTCR